ncbi:hypothetical protein BS50DRAFT_577070 [Corynespora cassiicola Philippines]|uniref:Zn(2)-C6 fungal-type domain-containing protein n=1 Tax=Corynespora cassiicola Philippines TaxID=1448308 RepID=A0A2T2NE57_CORCC|nr:hypothetical protein BS50DRAFT_577070 [Corynespora cassiicola Philippines]
MKKRYRACEDCHRLKIKCDVSISAGGACERCTRNNLECIPAAPRLQRDRINELETQIQELRDALRHQSSTTPTPSPGNLLDDHDNAILSFLDARVSPAKQQDLVYLFAHHAGAAWPVIRMPLELDHIRTKSPILLLSVMAYAFTQETQGTKLEVHDELVRETMHILGEAVIGRGQRSLELVQALLVAAFWSKTTRVGEQGSCFQLVQLAADMAIDIGIAGPSLQPSPAAYFCRHEDPSSLEARRTWLACFVALSASSMSTRRPSPVPWDLYHQECLINLESEGEPYDVLLCQIVRVIQLIEEISHQLRLCHLATFVDGNDYNTHTIIETLKDKVDAWTVQIPPFLSSSHALKVWRHVALIRIHEVALHTPTNKASFAAPFIPGRIAVSDFPRPTNIIPPLRTALGAMIQNCHAVIDTASKMDPALVLSLPAFCFAPAVLYSLFVLVNALVAATDPSNTYGQCLIKDNFRIEQCGLKLLSMTAYLKSLDPTMSSFTTRFIDATGWLEQWYNDYNAILQRYETNIAHV